MMAACCQSLAPKTATSGCTMLNSLATTVVTPRKWVGRDLPSMIGASFSSTAKVLKSRPFPRGYIFLVHGGEYHIYPFFPAQTGIAREVPRVA